MRYKDGKALSKAYIWEAMENIRLCLKYISECIFKSRKTFIYNGFPCFSDIDSQVRALKEYVINENDYELAKKLASYERLYFGECGYKWYSEDKQRYRKLLSVQLDLYDVYKWLLTTFFGISITEVDRYFLKEGKLYDRNTKEEIYPKGCNDTAKETSLSDNESNDCETMKKPNNHFSSGKSEVQLTAIFNSLVKKSFVAESSLSDWLFVFKGIGGLNSKIQWTALNSRTRKPSKRSLLDFLVIMGLSEKDIRGNINNCFIVKGSKSFSSKDYTGLKDWNRDVKSEYHKDLYQIVENRL